VDGASWKNRCIVTLDLDFLNPLVFPPEDYSGIAVLRLSSYLMTFPLQPLPMQFVDLKKQYQRYKDEIRKEMDRVLESAAFIHGGSTVTEKRSIR